MYRWVLSCFLKEAREGDAGVSSGRALQTVGASKVVSESKLGFYIPFNNQGHIVTGPQL